jgi:hypothetical protein
MSDNKVEYRRQYAISKGKLKKLIKDLKILISAQKCVWFNRLLTNYHKRGKC